MTKYNEEGQPIHHSTPFKNDFIYSVPLFTPKNKTLANKILCDVCDGVATENDLIIVEQLFSLREKHIHKKCKTNKELKECEKT
jgi:hypothetical protein